MTRVLNVPGWAVAQALREAEQRKARSLAARVLAWREKRRASSGARAAANKPDHGDSHRAGLMRGDVQRASGSRFAAAAKGCRP